MKIHWRPLLGVVVAIAVTTTMDATGLSDFSALPLLPLMLLFWYLQSLSRSEIGFRWGSRGHHLLAMLHPLLVLGAVALISLMAGVVDTSQAQWGKAALNILIISLSTVLVGMITEEGFFRGWLWASLHREGMHESRIVIWTSVAFSLWHWSSITLDTGFSAPLRQVPTFLLNAAMLGAIWGMLRWLSGSIVVASVAHGLWNGLAYTLFGFGSRKGALGITDTAVFSPEVGVLGLGLNIIFAGALLLLCMRQPAPRTSGPIPDAAHR